MNPVAFAEMLELLLYFKRRAALCSAHEVADRDVGRDIDKHMHMTA